MAERPFMYGWEPDPPPLPSFAPVVPSIPLPPKVDLRQYCPQPFSQGYLLSCTANVVAAALEYEYRRRYPDETFRPSRLFLYYQARQRYTQAKKQADPTREPDDLTQKNTGVPLEHACLSLQDSGVCPERLWGYVADRFTAAPPQTCYDDARTRRPVTCTPLDGTDIVLLKEALALQRPVVFGMCVFESFELPRVRVTGEVPVPDLAREELRGLHAVLAVGYDDAAGRFLVLNSWGPTWGQQGYFSLPYDYFNLQAPLPDGRQVPACYSYWTVALDGGEQ